MPQARRTLHSWQSRDTIRWRHRQVQYQGKGTLFASIITLANSAIGAGVLTFPYAFESAGLVLAIILCLCLALLMGFTLHVIAQSTEAAQKKDSRVRSYQDVVKLAMGERVSTAVEVALVLYLFGGCIAFLIIIGDMCQPLMPGEGIASHRSFIITLITLSIITPLCRSVDLGTTLFKALAVLAVTYMVCMIVGEEPQAQRRSGRRVFQRRCWFLFPYPDVPVLAVPYHVR